MFAGSCRTSWSRGSTACWLGCFNRPARGTGGADVDDHAHSHIETYQTPIKWNVFFFLCDSSTYTKVSIFLIKLFCFSILWIIFDLQHMPHRLSHQIMQVTEKTSKGPCAKVACIGWCNPTHIWLCL